MNTKMIVIKISLLLLAGLLSGNAAWAEGKAKSQTEDAGAKCKIIPGTKEVRNGAVLEFGDLKVLVKEYFMYNPGSRGYNAGIRSSVELDVKIKGVVPQVSGPSDAPGNINVDQRDSFGNNKQHFCGQDVIFGLSADKPELTVSIW